MGRPINKRWFGATGLGTGTGLVTGNNLPIRFKSNGTVYEGYILSQKGSRKFKCSNKDSSVIEVCKLVQGIGADPANNGEATLVGLVNGSSPVTVMKLSNRIAVDFSGIRYSWTLSDDSTETVLILITL